MYQDRNYNLGDRVLWVTMRDTSTGSSTPFITDTAWRGRTPTSIQSLCLVEAMFTYSLDQPVISSGGLDHLNRSREHVFLAYSPRRQRHSTTSWNTEPVAVHFTINAQALLESVNRVRNAEVFTPEQQEFVLKLLAPVVVGSQGYFNMLNDIARLTGTDSTVRLDQTEVGSSLIEQASRLGLELVGVPLNASGAGVWSELDLQTLQDDQPDEAPAGRITPLHGEGTPGRSARRVTWNGASGLDSTTRAALSTVYDFETYPADSSSADTEASSESIDPF